MGFARNPKPFPGHAIKGPYFGTLLSSTRLVMGTLSAPIITPPKSGRQENAAMKTSIADAAGMDASPTGAARDTDASIYSCVVTRGTCRRVRPIISGRFATARMSNAARRPASAIGSITDFQSQIALFTFLGTVDSSADPGGAFGRF
jgi:hypothetical protein